jgi:hypothetical protein
MIERSVYPAHTHNKSVGEVAAAARRYRLSVHSKYVWRKKRLNDVKTES